MGDSEEYFPRGGKKPTTKYFKQNENFLGTAGKSEKKKKPKRKNEDDDGYLSDELRQEVDQSYKNCGIWLNYKVVKEGQLFLGRVQLVQETKVYVSLPCRMSGVVMACHISEAYNNMLEAYVNDQIENVRELPQMFKLGQYVAVKVLEVKSNQLLLSMMPQHINCGRLHAELQKGAILQAAVSSEEDHGYVMDIGVANTRAFLPKTSTNPETELYTGMLTWVTIKSISPSAVSSVVTLSSELSDLQKAVQRKTTSVLLPGTALEFIVDKPLENGIEGRILGNTTAYVQRHHVVGIKGKKPSLGQKIRVGLLYVVAPNNIPFLTTRNIFESTCPDLTQEQKLSDGDIVEEAQVIKISGRSIHLKLCEGSVGVLSLRRVALHEDLTDEQILLKSYPIGSVHRVRVLCYNLSDHVYSVSDAPHVLAEQHFKLAQLRVGDVVAATVSSVADNHLRVTVGRVAGYVPQTHMSETGIFIDPKKVSNSKLSAKKYKVGQVVQARVLHTDLAKQQLILSLKPSLLDPELEVLQSYTQAVVGNTYTGIIAHIKDYLIVSFFNNVTAFVAKRYVSAEPPQNLADAYHLGQIVKCTIQSVNPELKRMVGSLINTPLKLSENRKKPEKRKTGTPKEPKSKKQKTEKNENEQIKKSNDNISNEKEEIKAKKKMKELRKEQQAETSMNSLTSVEDNAATVSLSSAKRNKTKKNIGDTSDVTNDDKNDTEDTLSAHLKKKKNSDRSTDESSFKKSEYSDGSDAIEIDIQEDSDQILTPHDLGLIDLSDCHTAKNYKKRVVALLKAIKARAHRVERIDKKIANIETKGLHKMNKKYHTAMHMEKLTIEERTKKLLEALKLAQEKLKNFNIEIDKSYKKKKDISASEQSKSEERIENNEKANKKEKKKRKRETIKANDNTTKEIDADDINNKKKVDKNEKKEKFKVLEPLEPAIDVPSAKDFWTMDEQSLNNNAKEEESSSSEEEEQEKPKKKRKKLTIAEKVAKAREEEERLREMEKRAIESESGPRSSDQFERALLAQPDCSQLWIAYMAFHLQATEIDKARAVARKALHTINFREEDEKLNVWLALLNLEHRFGTKESQQKTLEEALQMNDTYKVHSKLLGILLDTGKQPELVSLVELMTRKYRRLAEAYGACGDACFAAGLLEKARQVMQKGIAALEKKEHVALLVRFARLERAHGAGERAEALCEQVLAVYPQRVDVCCVYADMLLASGDVERARQVMERMTSQKLPARKMKVLYKKWVEIEEKIGDETHVNSVRQRALEFIEKAKF